MTTAYYYTQYKETRGAFEQFQSIVTDTNILIDYGNGTANWHNQTIMAGSTAFDALLAATKKVGYNMTANGVYVWSINDLAESVARTPTSVTGTSWFFYQWSTSGSNWTLASTGADQYILKPNDSTAWRFESYSYSWT